MRKVFRGLSVIVFAILIGGFISTAQALDKSVELTDIKVNNLNERTTIDINTTRPVKFLYYKLESPARLVIDFVGTNIISLEPERIIFSRGYVREIQSVFYEATEADTQPKLDLLILKFRPNVTIKVESKKDGILLKAEETIAVSKSEDSSVKLVEARKLAEEIVQEKKLAYKKGKITSFAKIPIIEKRVEKDVPFKQDDAFLTSASYILNLYENSIKKELEKLASKEVKSKEDKKSSIVTYTTTKEIESTPKITQDLEPKVKSKFNWSALAIISATIGSVLLISLLFLRVKRASRETEHEEELPDLEEILKYQPDSQLEEIKFVGRREDHLDKCLEKRKFARFDLPHNDALSVCLDLETEGLNKVSTQAKNLSLGGVGVELNKDIKIPSVLQLGLRLPVSQEANQALARIAWFKEKDNDSCYYGLSFIMLTDDEEKKIRRFLNDNF